MLATAIYSRLWRLIRARGLNTRFSQVDPTKVKACKMMSKEMIIIWGHSRGPPDHKGNKNNPLLLTVVFLSRFQHIFSWFQTWNHWKRFKINKKLKTAQKSISTSFQVRAAPKSWLKYTTVACSLLQPSVAISFSFFYFQSLLFKFTTKKH